jgi:Putative MetA-pathway of phenol degradation
MPHESPAFPRVKKHAACLLGGLLALGATAQAQQPEKLPTKPGIIRQEQQPVIIPGQPGTAHAPGHVEHGRGGHCLFDSICGTTDCACWTPLCNHGEGWGDPWIRPPHGPSGARREHWLNAADGFFTREVRFFYFWTDNIAKLGDSHVGLFSFQTPLSRRCWIGVDLPFTSLTGFNGDLDTSGRFGDLTVTPKVMLRETEDTSLSAGLAVRWPTGTGATGDDLLTLTPFVAVWRDIGGGASFHGAFGVEVPINDDARAVLPDATLIGSLAVGQSVNGCFSYYVALNVRQELGTADEHTFLSITPGIRTHLGHHWYFLAAYEVPLVGPRFFDQRVLAGLIREF